MTLDDYLWKYSIPLIKIMAMDNSHVNYLSEKEAKFKGRGLNMNKSVDEMNNDLGVKINFPNE